jgi:hypothetical protein
LRETRLTASLGFLLARRPAALGKLFNLPEHLNAITLEHAEESGRSDIRIDTAQGVWIIEAKRDGSNPLHQARRYAGQHRVLLTDHVPLAAERELLRTHWVTWRDLGCALRELERVGSSAERFVCGEFRRYLEGHSMIPEAKTPPEIYVRDVNDPAALELFLEARLYECNYERKGSLAESRYFAPHLGWTLARSTPSIRRGFSYIARIEQVAVCTSRGELRELLRKERGRAWLRAHQEAVEAFDRRFRWVKNVRRSVVFLGPPRLVFNPPIPKENVQKGRGFLSKRTLAFDELFTAWEGLRQSQARRSRYTRRSIPRAKRKPR